MNTHGRSASRATFLAPARAAKCVRADRGRVWWHDTGRKSNVNASWITIRILTWEPNQNSSFGKFGKRSKPKVWFWQAFQSSTLKYQISLKSLVLASVPTQNVILASVARLKIKKFNFFVLASVSSSFANFGKRSSNSPKNYNIICSNKF